MRCCILRNKTSDPTVIWMEAANVSRILYCNVAMHTCPCVSLSIALSRLAYIAGMTTWSLQLRHTHTHTHSCAVANQCIQYTYSVYAIKIIIGVLYPQTNLFTSHEECVRRIFVRIENCIFHKSHDDQFLMQKRRRNADECSFNFSLCDRESMQHYTGP